MKKIILTIILFLSATYICYGAPSLTSATYNSDDGTITISGSDLGSHPDYDVGENDTLCVAWDDFESGSTDSQYENTESTTLASDSQMDNSSYSVKIDNTTTISENGDDGLELHDLTTANACYIEFYIRADDSITTAAEGYQFKPYRIRNSNGAHDQLVEKIADTSLLINIEDVSGDSAYIDLSENVTDSGWHHIAIYTKYSSGIGETDGVRQVFYDGVESINDTSLQTDNGADNDFNDSWVIHDYMKFYNGGFYYDNACMDQTRARVWITDDESLPQYQPPTSWSTTEVVVDVNDCRIANCVGKTLTLYDEDGNSDTVVITASDTPSNNTKLSNVTATNITFS